MALDPNIILRGSEMQQEIQQQNRVGLQNLIGTLGQIGYDSKVRKMRQLEKPEDQQAFANNSLFANKLNTQLAADREAAAKAAADQLKFDADLAKARAEEEKIRTETKGASLKNSVDLLENANRALAVVAQTGDAYAATLALNNSYKAGAITPELYEQYSQQIKSLSNKPQELKQYVQGIILSGEENAMKYIQADQNTVLNNKTSRENNQNSVNAQIYGSDKQFQSNQDKLEFAKSQVPVIYNEQQQALKNGTAELVTINGVTYVDYGNGEGEPYINAKGEQVTPPPKPTETKVQKLERQEKVIGYRDAAQTAAESAQLAAQLVSDSSNLNMSAARMAIESKIPGQPAHTFAQRIETLKSQVFLNQVKQMQGMGALTDAEGARLEKSIASLDIYQDPVELQNNLTSIAQTMAKAAKSARDRVMIYKDDGQQQTQVQMPSANTGRPSASYMP